MKTRLRHVLVIATLVMGGMVATQGAALAAPGDPFLCPIVGDGVLNADAHNNDNGVSAITPAPGTSLLPGNNQAGANANSNAYNELPPSDPNAGPGGNSGFSAIWPEGAPA